MGEISLLCGDRVEYTVNLKDVDIAITLGLDLVSREVKWGGEPIKESVLGEVLIVLGLKMRRFWKEGCRVKPSGLKNVCVTDEFCDKLKDVITVLMEDSLWDKTIKVEKSKGS